MKTNLKCPFSFFQGEIGANKPVCAMSRSFVLCSIQVLQMYVNVCPQNGGGPRTKAPEH